MRVRVRVCRKVKPVLLLSWLMIDGFTGSPYSGQSLGPDLIRGVSDSVDTLHNISSLCQFGL